MTPKLLLNYSWNTPLNYPLNYLLNYPLRKPECIVSHTRTDGRTDILTPWAPVGAKKLNFLYTLKFTGIGFVHVLDFVVWHCALQTESGDQTVQPPWITQLGWASSSWAFTHWEGHTSDSWASPTQSAPPLEGTGLLQKRVRDLLQELFPSLTKIKI